MNCDANELFGSAFAVWLVGRTQSEEFMSAIAWLIMRRAKTAVERIAANDGRHPEFGDGTLVQAAKSVLRDMEDLTLSQSGLGTDNIPPLNSISFRRALAIVCLVMNEEISDPTHGAVYCHHHLENPSWAVATEPSALIGPLFFYDAVSTPVSRKPVNFC